MSKSNFGKLLCILALLAAAGNAVAQRKQALQQEYYGAEAARIVPGASYVKPGTNTPYPSFVRLEASSRISPAAFLPWLKQQVKSNAAIGFRLIKQEKDQQGVEHYRYVQTYRNIPIDKTTYLAHVKNGVLTSFNGQALDVPQQPDTRAALNEKQALQHALKHVGAARYKWEDEFWEKDLKEHSKDPNATYYPKGEQYWRPFEDGRTLRLAYRFDINSASPDKAQRVYVDANTGALLQTLPMESNCAATSVNSIFNGNRSISTEKYTSDDFRLRDDCQSAEIHIRDWNSTTTSANPAEIENTTNTWTTMNERFGATVLWQTKQAYNYYLNVHTRNSYNNGNGDVNGYINAVFDCSPPAGCTSTNNASMSFSGGNMKVGLGSSGTLANSFATVDIIGHEYTHAVTGSSAQLAYENESGALNESFSDIFGEAIENYVLGSNDWLMGDERSNGAIRSMSNPNSFGDPDTYLGTSWYNGTNDNGGVHTNSGVQNFWFYLLTVGGSGTNDNGDAYSVSGIGLAKASAIAYGNLIGYLGENSTYADARTGAIQAAIDLYGSCSNEVKQVTNAWYAVGVGAPYFDAATVVTSNYNGRHVSCNNACDGSATVNVTSGVGPVYLWSTGATTQSVSGLCPGNYSVTVTNILGLGCSVTRNVTISNTPLLTTSPTPSSYNGYGVSCFGSSNGMASAGASGGTPPYSYSWSNGQTTATATGLSAGSYSVTVTDANGCTASANVTITQPPLLTTDAAPTSDYNGYNVQCTGGNNGSAEAYPAGGVQPYSYSWSDGQTTREAINLYAITYTVTVTDANGCTAKDSTTLTEPPALPVASITIDDHGGLCSNIDLTAHSSTTENLYAWSNGETTQTISLDLTDPDGVYSVFVTDQQGCTSEDSAVYVYAKQNLLNSYTIVGLDLVSLDDENNVESGSVGVKNGNGDAWFGKNSSVAAPGAFVKADEIHVQNPVNIPLRFYSAATVPLPALQLNNSQPPLLSVGVVLSNQAVTLNGDYNSLTIGGGANVTLNGTAFGTITVASDATVTFTQSEVNIGTINTLPGLFGHTTLKFSGDCNVKISGSVSLGGRNVVNPDGKKVMFFMSNQGLLFLQPEFAVSGNATTVNANILMPYGRIKVTGGLNTCHMNGVFMANEIVSYGKKIVWNNNNCSGMPRGVASVETEEQGSAMINTFDVRVSPNPSNTHFVISTQSAETAPVHIRIMDVSGKVVEELRDVAPNTGVTAGQQLAVGSYFAEVLQGSNRKVRKLIKLN